MPKHALCAGVRSFKKKKKKKHSAIYFTWGLTEKSYSGNNVEYTQFKLRHYNIYK